MPGHFMFKTRAWSCQACTPSPGAATATVETCQDSLSSPLTEAILGSSLCQEIQRDWTGHWKLHLHAVLGLSDIKARDAFFQIPFPTCRIQLNNDNNKIRSMTGAAASSGCSFLWTKHSATIMSELEDETLAQGW